MAAVHFRHYLPPNISHLTLVFKTQNGENWRNGNVTLSWALVHAYASALWAEAIAWTCKGGQLCIVNAGALAVAKEEEPPYVPDCAALQAAVRRYFAIRIAEQMGDDAPRTMERLTFLSMDEYLASPDAGDVFDRNE
ncbi:hypothetical protein CspeluHIS016_0406460 [Cutaneotrichosporon spelunceum]|uniref:Uncharacterized protein n=1 Tax=Cutaneotrichosporon spelunceum TaxID=1672016 RepID=A0AAD3TVS1_9TREE|nr:hypothetical protein CspeluHIS016_0406460 [Cutaneotrichosporon spelunceum]